MFRISSCHTVDLNLRTTTSQKREAVPRRARIEGSTTCTSFTCRLENNENMKKKIGPSEIALTLYDPESFIIKYTSIRTLLVMTVLCSKFRHRNVLRLNQLPYMRFYMKRL